MYESEIFPLLSEKRRETGFNSSLFFILENKMQFNKYLLSIHLFIYASTNIINYIPTVHQAL